MVDSVRPAAYVTERIARGPVPEAKAFVARGRPTHTRVGYRFCLDAMEVAFDG
jgi:hypothetical protein